MPEISDDGSARNTSLNRYAFMLRLRPGAEDAYEATHRAVWPEMLSLLKEAGISEYSIYRRDDLLILEDRAGAGTPNHCSSGGAACVVPPLVRLLSACRTSSQPSSAS